MPAARGAPDGNQAEIVKRYEGWFCSVVDLHSVGFGCPDLLVGINGVSELVEVKSEDGRVLPAQVTFARDWRGAKPVMVRSIDDVDNHVIAVRMRLKQQKWGSNDKTQELDQAEAAHR